MKRKKWLKEAILRTSILYGVPRSLQALLPLFAIVPDDRIDASGPRYIQTVCNDISYCTSFANGETLA